MSSPAPEQEYQRLRDAAVDIIREMGVECGGSNVQASQAGDGREVQQLLVGCVQHVLLTESQP